MSNQLDFSSEHIHEDLKLCQTQSKSKRGGPYTGIERTKRRDEVYRLHFDYGYSARKIADLMKVNKDTIINDLKFWYSKIRITSEIKNPENVIIKKLHRLEVQRTRLRELLDKASSIEDKLSIERILYDIDCSIIHINQRLAESSRRVYDRGVTAVNNWLRERGVRERCLSCRSMLNVSKDALAKINKLIEEDHTMGSNLMERKI